MHCAYAVHLFLQLTRANKKTPAKHLHLYSLVIILVF